MNTPPHANVTVRVPRRPVLRRVIVTRDLTWLHELRQQMSQVFELLDMPRRNGGGGGFIPPNIQKPALVLGLCAEIEGGDCCVCMELIERKDVRKFGCGHDTCVTCYEQIYNTTAKCPLCRAHIEEVSRAPERRSIRVVKNGTPPAK